jgi:hypothetical protein
MLSITRVPAKSFRLALDRSDLINEKSGACDPTSGRFPVVCISFPPSVIVAMGFVFNCSSNEIIEG